MTFRLLMLIGFISLRAGAAELDLCGLGSLDSVVGKLVTLRARMGFTAHGMFLLTDQCSDETPSAVVVNPHDMGVPNVDFELDKKAPPMLRPYLRLTGGGATACGVIVGEFVSHRNFRAQHRGPTLQGNGFGPRGAFRFAFVLQNVAEISACP